MKKCVSLMILVLLIISGFSCSFHTSQRDQTGNIKETQQQIEKKITDIVENFGSKLNRIPFSSSIDTVKNSITITYSDLVTPELLQSWLSDISKVPGRINPGPWLDYIEIDSMTEIKTDFYLVRGYIVERNGSDKKAGYLVEKRKVTISLMKTDYKWLINNVQLGDYVDNLGILYENSLYGFRFRLPASWKNAQILMNQWDGYAVNSPSGSHVIESGPLLSIRNPLWTSETPRQDIPIMIFTFPQWDKLYREEMNVGAAPIGPSELGRNNKYVFALPARYNYAFPAGYQEVEEILNTHPLEPFPVMP